MLSFPLLSCVPCNARTGTPDNDLLEISSKSLLIVLTSFIPLFLVNNGLERVFKVLAQVSVVGILE